LQESRAGTPGNALHPLTRYSYLPLAFLTAIFGPILVLFPGSTEDYWSWPIQPDMSAVWVGSAYTFGAVAISTMLLRGRWTEAIVPVISTWPFSVVMLAATIIHNDRFFLGTLNYYVWLAIYVYLPFALPVMYFLNGRQDPGVSVTDTLLPVRLRVVLSVAGAVTALYGLLLIFEANTVLDTWPWQLTPLMAKVIGGWLLFIATGTLWTAIEARYAAYRYYFPVAALWFALLFVASVANRDDFDDGLSKPLYFAVLATAIVGSLAIYRLMGRSESRATLSPVEVGGQRHDPTSL
jgi:hypothetical protein